MTYIGGGALVNTKFGRSRQRTVSCSRTRVLALLRPAHALIP
eukprot:SAG11_NODE_36377_length_261_cov_50.919753_1_plen_41_part_01